MFDLVDLIFSILCLIALAVSWLKDPRKTKSALRYSIRSSLPFLPLFIAIFAIIGIMEVFVSKKFIIWAMGSSRGILAPVFAAIVGGILGGPPPVAYPLAKYLLKQHASMAAAATFIVSWSAVGTISLPIQIKFIGQKLALTLWVSMLIFSIIVGVLMGWLISI